MGFTRKALAALMVVLVVVSIPATAAGPAINYGADDTPNPWADIDTLTKSSHPMEEGTSHEAVEGYYDDSGDWVSPSDSMFVVNTTSDIEDGTNVNPYSYTVTDIEDNSFGAFPRKGSDENDPDTDAPAAEDNLASALDASEWSKSGANKSKLTISDTETADGVAAVNFDTGTGMSDGDVATGTYSNWSSELDSDESKRVLMLGADVNSLDAGGNVTIDVVDESGDYKRVVINSSEDASTHNVLADSAADGYVLQEKLSNLTTVGGGSWSNIEKIQVTVNDADADVSLAWVDLQKKGEVTVGKQTVDGPDDDTDYDDTEEHVDDFSGDISVHSLDTLDSEFDDAVIHDLSYPATVPASELDASNTHHEWGNASDFPNFDATLDAYWRFELPAAIDLSYSGVSLEDVAVMHGDRYVTAEYKEGVSEDTFEDGPSDISGFSSISGYDAEGDEITIDNTVSTANGMVVHLVVKYTDSQLDSVQGSSDGGAGMGPDDGSGDGLFDWLIGLPGAVISVGAAVIQRMRGGWPFGG